MSATHDPTRWSRAGLVEGARRSLPLVPGTIVMAAAIGTLAAQKGLTLLETTLMSALVFAGGIGSRSGVVNRLKSSTDRPMLT